MISPPSSFSGKEDYFRSFCLTDEEYPFGHSVIHKVAMDNFVKPFNFVFLTGDIAYAGMNSQQVGEMEPIWDIFG